MNPAVSVLMAARDAAPWLDEALGSIRAQSFADMDVIVVDDGSQDGTGGILAAHAGGDPRLRVLRNERPAGLAAALNRAIGAARGEILVRMDADDVAEPERVGELVDFLHGHPEVVVAGSNVSYIDAGGRARGESDLAQGDAAIRGTCLMENPFVHPAVAMRARPFRDGVRYDETFDTSQDWELWTRLLEWGAGANLPGKLLRLRQHPASVSATRRERQRANSLRILERHVPRVLEPGAWSPERFALLVDGFLQGRAEADAAGVDRIAACHEALDLLGRLQARCGARGLGELRRRMVGRAIRMGLVPPLRPGWPGLLARLLRSHAAVVGPAIMRLSRPGQPLSA